MEHKKIKFLLYIYYICSKAKIRLSKHLSSEKTVFNIFDPIKKLFFLILIILTHNVYAGERDSISIYQGSKTIFFVSENTVVHGQFYITSTGTSKTPALKKKAKAKAKPKTKGIAEQLKLKKSHDAQLIQNIKDQINSRKAYHYHQSSDQQLNLLDQYQTNVSVSGGDSNPVYIPHPYYLIFLKIQFSKQQFYSSVSYLQFSRLLDSFLRGPPDFS